MLCVAFNGLFIILAVFVLYIGSLNLELLINIGLFLGRRKKTYGEQTIIKCQHLYCFVCYGGDEARFANHVCYIVKEVHFKLLLILIKVCI